MGITIITPTIRPEIIEDFLDQFLNQSQKPNEIIIICNLIDQKQEIVNIIQLKKYNDLKVRLLTNTCNSLSTARALGVKETDINSDIIVFLDDDTEFQSDFLKEISLFFLNNPQANGGVANISTPSRKIGFMKKIGLFLLTGSYKPHDFYIGRGGFNAMPLRNPTKEKAVERCSGCAMAFRKNVLNDPTIYFPIRFMKYSLMEDCFLSYDIYKKKGNIQFIPNAKITHLETPSARIANYSKIYQNIIHRYLFVKRFGLSLIRYFRTMIIMCIFDCLTFMSLSPIKYYMKGLQYIYKYRNEIENEDFNFNTFIFP